VENTNCTEGKFTALISINNFVSIFFGFSRSFYIFSLCYPNKISLVASVKVVTNFENVENTKCTEGKFTTLISINSFISTFFGFSFYIFSLCYPNIISLVASLKILSNFENVENTNCTECKFTALIPVHGAP
jgi:hypothetical protein